MTRAPIREAVEWGSEIRAEKEADKPIRQRSPAWPRRTTSNRQKVFFPNGDFREKSVASVEEGISGFRFHLAPTSAGPEKLGLP